MKMIILTENIQKTMVQRSCAACKSCSGPDVAELTTAKSPGMSAFSTPIMYN